MKFVSMFLAIVLLSLSPAAFATSQVKVLIVSIQAGQNLGNGAGAVVITFGQNNSGSLSCVGSIGLKSYAIDPTTAQGRSAIALAELAFTTGRTVTAEGSGFCTIYGQTEDLGFMYTTD